MRDFNQLVIALVVSVLVHAGTVVAAEAVAPVAPLAIDTQAVVDRGLAALVKLQQPDGLIGEGTGISALAGMALLAGGHTPTRGLYHEASGKCLRAVLTRQDHFSGYLATDYGNMYAHGFSTLYLAESYGMAPDQPVRSALEAAVDLIYRAQNSEGGWRYSPTPTDADISVTICQVMALRAANNVGIGGQQSQDCIARAIAYVRRCANGDGSFAYVASSSGNWGNSGAEGVPRTAAGAMSLIGAGIADLADPTLGPSMRFLRKHYPSHLKGSEKGTESYFWYGQYYTAQALFHSPDAADWDEYWNLAVPVITARQDRNGLWLQGEGPGPAYNSAMALIILQIPNNYLPIFQR